MTPANPIRIDKSFEFSNVQEVTTSAIPYIKIKGFASRAFNSGKMVIDADSEHISTLGIDLSRMNTGNVPLLFNHSQDKACGKITKASYVPDGLEIEAVVYKLDNDALTNYVYNAVKAGILSSFSVGILVSDFNVVTQDGQDYLQLSKSLLIETSVVSVPSNAQATFMVQEVNDGTTKSLRTMISKSVLKEENPDACSQFGECMLANKSIETKAISYEDTKNEGYHKWDQFQVYLSALSTTIEDNWFAHRWEEQTPQEVISNLQEAFKEFLEDQGKLMGIEVPSEAIEEPLGSPQDTEEMHPAATMESLVSNINDSASTEDLLISTKGLDTMQEKGKVTTKDTEVVEPVLTEETKVETTPEEIQVPATPAPLAVDAPEVTQVPAEIPKVEVRTLNDLLSDVSKIKVDELEEAELETVYEALASVTELIESMVVNQIKAEMV